MTQNFFSRLRGYYEHVGAVLRGQAETASVFPNSTDIGTSRERVYAEFLRLHAPSKCNVFLGGFLFDMKGNESKQLDVLVTTDTTPRFDFHNKDGAGKSFCPVEGTLGVASIKSVLDKSQLEDALKGFASIPPTEVIAGRETLGVNIVNYEDWPYKILYASAGIAPATLLKHLRTFYEENPHIPVSRRPQIVHVAGQCLLLRIVSGMSLFDGPSGEPHQAPPIGTYQLITRTPDLQAITVVLDALQQFAQASTHILFSYEGLMDRVNRAPS